MGDVVEVLLQLIEEGIKHPLSLDLCCPQTFVQGVVAIVLDPFEILEFLQRVLKFPYLIMDDLQDLLVHGLDGF